MNRNPFLWSATILAIALAVLGWAAHSWAQSGASQSVPKVTAEQQKQLDQLKQLEGQLQKDRADLHEAISKYGRDSDEVDAAEQQLFQDRTDYRKLRRSLRQAGVPVPPPTGFGPGGSGLGYGRRMGRGGPGMGGRPERGIRQCPCADM